MTNPGRFLPLVLLVAVSSHTPVPSLAQSKGEDEINASIHKFSQVYGAIEANFADKVDPDIAVYRGAIPGMLRTLDPHSAFYDPKSWQLMREGQSGHYYGVGMLIGAAAVMKWWSCIRLKVLRPIARAFVLEITSSRSTIRKSPSRTPLSFRAC